MLTTQVLTFIGLGMSLFAVAIYVVKFFGKWSSKKMLSIETGIDAFYTGFHLYRKGSSASAPAHSLIRALSSSIGYPQAHVHFDDCKALSCRFIGCM